MPVICTTQWKKGYRREGRVRRHAFDGASESRPALFLPHASGRKERCAGGAPRALGERAGVLLTRSRLALWLALWLALGTLFGSPLDLGTRGPAPPPKSTADRIMPKLMGQAAPRATKRYPLVWQS